jgi:hypothetical protein
MVLATEEEHRVRTSCGVKLLGQRAMVESFKANGISSATPLLGRIGFVTHSTPQRSASVGCEREMDSRLNEVSVQKGR